MVDFLIKVGVWLVLTIILYLFGSFVAWSFDIGDWWATGRILAGAIEIGLIVRIITTDV